MKLINIRPREGGGGGRSIYFAREEMVQRRMQNFWFIGLSVLGIVLPDRLVPLDQRI